MVAAPTTSLPERIGGIAELGLPLLLAARRDDDAAGLGIVGIPRRSVAWRQWLLRAVAGSPADLQIAYGIGGEHRLRRSRSLGSPAIGTLSRCESATRPVSSFSSTSTANSWTPCSSPAVPESAPEQTAWDLETALMDYLETAWPKPDEGIWEIRGPRQQFTHSKVMAWVAFDRAVKCIERFGLDGPLDRWRQIRSDMHAEVCRKGWSEQQQSFVQYYGGQSSTRRCLMIPLVGFLPADDPRVRDTVRAIERGLIVDGFVRRYAVSNDVDGLPPGEGVFLPCTFWLADNCILAGRRAEAEQLFDRLLSLRNDVGLLSEQYDPAGQQLVGNFPQALTHIGLINTAVNLARADKNGGLHRSRSRGEDQSESIPRR